MTLKHATAAARMQGWSFGPLRSGLGLKVSSPPCKVQAFPSSHLGRPGSACNGPSWHRPHRQNGLGPLH
eukprot:6752476-Alexandrium_andersonii.AAC.1